MFRYDLVVTRHVGLVKWLLTKDLLTADAIILTHVNHDETGVLFERNVIGILPHNLSCHCKTFSEVALNLPEVLRGKELTEEDVEKYQTGIMTYEINRIINL